jgi:chromosome segregation ATPase
MSRPSDYLGGAPQLVIRSEADQLRGALSAVREVTAEQGQVMAAALDNNRSLWETNKRLRRDLQSFESRAQHAEARANALQRKLEEIPDGAQLAELAQRNRELEQAVATLKTELARSMYPELDTEQRKAELQRLANQSAELAASGLVPTPEQVAREDHARDPQPGEFQLSKLQLPGETAQQYADRTGRTFEE